VSEQKVRYTIVVEWPSGQEPGIGANDFFKGGRVVAAQFSDALAELESVYERFPNANRPHSFSSCNVANCPMCQR